MDSDSETETLLNIFIFIFMFMAYIVDGMVFNELVLSQFAGIVHCDLRFY